MRLDELIARTENDSWSVYLVDLTREEILGPYKDWPFENHPLWQLVFSGELTLAQVLRAEKQHYIRSNVGREFRKRAAEQCANVSARAYALLMQTYLEECTDDASGPSHLELIRRLLVEGGVREKEFQELIPTPGNAAAIALYKDIADRGPLHHMIGAGAVEFFYSQLSPRIYDAYVTRYGMSPHQAETYRLHGTMDQDHAERALSILDDPAVRAKAGEIRLAVRDAFVATSLHYDGMLQAALENKKYWSGS